MNILLTIFIVLVVLGGTYLATSIFAGKKPSLTAATIHGLIGLIILIMLGYHAGTVNSKHLWIPFGILLLTSIGGLYLVSNHKKDQPGPKKMVVIHGIFSLIGILLTLKLIWAL